MQHAECREKSTASGSTDRVLSAHPGSLRKGLQKRGYWSQALNGSCPSRDQEPGVLLDLREVLLVRPRATLNSVCPGFLIYKREACTGQVLAFRRSLQIP